MEPKHHVFLDANVYLRFYKLSDADVKELGQLVTLVKSGEVKLYLTEQSRDEFNRNRDEAIAESLKGVREQVLKPSNDSAIASSRFRLNSSRDCSVRACRVRTSYRCDLGDLSSPVRPPEPSWQGQVLR